MSGLLQATIKTGKNQTPRLADLIPAYVLQSLMNAFYDETSEPATIFDADNLEIVLHGPWTKFCKLVRSINDGPLRCSESDKAAILQIGETGEPRRVRCHAGLWNLCAPIRLVGDLGKSHQRDSEIIGYLIAGQYRDGSESLRNVGWHGIEEHPSGKDLRREFEQIGAYDSGQIDELGKKFLALRNLIERIASAAFEHGMTGFLPLLNDLANARGLDELTAVVLRKLPLFVHARACSIFLVQWDSECEDYRLVLRATSFEKLRPRIQQLGYCNGEGLTGWVWAHNSALRLRDLRDPAELARYPGLAWRELSDDSDIHREFLAAPIPGLQGKPVGVIRLPASETLEGFTDRDEIAVQTAAREIGRALVDQWYVRSIRLLHEIISLHSILVKISSFDQLVDAVLKTMERVFQEKGRRFFFHRLRASGHYWEVVRSVGDLPVKPGRPTLFPIQQGLAGQAMMAKKPMILLNVKQLEKPWDYVDLVEKTESALVAPMLMTEGCFGALAVVADTKYAFLVARDHDDVGPETLFQEGIDDLAVLELIAQVSAFGLLQLRFQVEMLRERDKAFQAFAGAATHALGNWLATLESEVRNRGWSEQNCGNSLRSMRGLIKSFKSFISLADVRPAPISLESLLEQARQRTPRENIEWKMPVIDWIVSADADRTIAVICELIANAFEHGRAPVEVWVSTERHSSLPDIAQYCVHVQDCGEGIPSNFQPHIFEFGWSSAVDHSGMGLSSCLYVAKRQGGALDYLDQIEGGAHFRLFLPLLERRDEN